MEPPQKRPKKKEADQSRSRRLLLWGEVLGHWLLRDLAEVVLDYLGVNLEGQVVRELKLEEQSFGVCANSQGIVAQSVVGSMGICMHDVTHGRRPVHLLLFHYGRTAMDDSHLYYVNVDGYLAALALDSASSSSSSPASHSFSECGRISYARSMAVSETHLYILTAARIEARLKPKQEIVASQPVDRAHSLAYSHGELFVFHWGMGIMMVHDALTLVPLLQWLCHKGTSEFTALGGELFLLSSHEDRRIQVVSRDGQLLCEITPPGLGPAGCICHDGHSLVVTSKDGMYIQWVA